MRRVILPALLGAGALLSAGTGSAGAAPPQAATVHNLITTANRHGNVAGYFAPSAVLQVSAHRYRGRTAITTWFRQQMAHGLRLTLKSTVYVNGNRVNVVIGRVGSDCPHGCIDGMQGVLSGDAFTHLSLQPLRALPSTPGHPPAHPAPPPGPQPTGTIPS